MVVVDEPCPCCGSHLLPCEWAGMCEACTAAAGAGARPVLAPVLDTQRQDPAHMTAESVVCPGCGSTVSLLYWPPKATPTCHYCNASVLFGVQVSVPADRWQRVARIARRAAWGIDQSQAEVLDQLTAEDLQALEDA